MRTSNTIEFKNGYPVINGRPVTRLLGNGDSNTKLRKNRSAKYRTYGLSLSPADSAGIGNTCPNSSPGCRAACLDHQGLASVWSSIQEARVRKTRAFYFCRDWFLDQLRRELTAADTICRKHGMRPAVRLNVFSDIPWERFGILDEFPRVQFYDYTNNPNRVGLVRPNYWVTYSKSEINTDSALEVLRAARGNVAVVFADRANPYCGNRSSKQRLPKTWRGFPVIDGDESDLRFQDTRGKLVGRVVGLRLKSHSRAERQGAIDSGFAVEF